MAKEQTKRRRKRYDAGSAYAGDVRPSGVLRVLSGPTTIKIVFLAMALALAAGGATAIIFQVFGTNASGPSTGNPQGFVVPGDDEGATATPATGAEGKTYDNPPALTIDESKTYLATITTSRGAIQVELFAGQVPATVNNFVFLAQDGFYDGLTFFRVEQDFLVQSGDPSGTGSGGPGYQLPQEEPGPFEAGEIGMANASQFFIALTDDESFVDFTPFGRVVSGLDVAGQIQPSDRIETIEITEQ